MTPESWEEVRRLFHQALDQPPDKRSSLVESALVSQEVRDEVRSLLASSASGDSLLVHPAIAMIQPKPAGHSIPDALVSRLPGTEVAERYRIDRLIGRGGHSLVFCASDRRTADQRVVLKVLSGESDAREWLEKKFQQELLILSRIRHPAVVGVRDCGVLPGGQPFLVTDFVEGVTLRERLRHPLTTAQAACVIVQIGSALQAAHDQGVVHRDVKPENVMVSAGNTTQPAVKLIDFGIARIERLDGSANSTAAVIAGTMKYMAPEQFVGRSSAASDVYSLAVLCYEMLTAAAGKRAFSNGETLSPDLIESTAALPRPVRRLLSAALALDPSKRPGNAEEFAAAVAKSALNGGRATIGGLWRAAILSAFAAAAAAIVMLAMRHTNRPPMAAPQRLTSENEFSADPSLSADGKTLAYASDGGTPGPLQIWVQSPPGSAPRRLTDDPGGAQEPSISGDGSAVVYRSGSKGGGIDLIPVRGGNARRIGDRGRRPQFSPDGRTVAYYVEPLWSGDCKIYVVDVDGGAPNRLKHGCRHSVGSPVWSPDGKQLLFWCDDANEKGERESDWWTLDLATGRTVKTGAYHSIREQAELRPYYQYFEPEQWTGTEVLFAAVQMRSLNLWTIPLSEESGNAGYRLHPAVASPLKQERRGSLARVTGANTPMAFADLAEDVQVYSVPLDANRGTTHAVAKRLTSGEGTSFWPSASFSGNRIAYISKSDPIRRLFFKDLSNGAERLIAPDVPLAPRLSPDGSDVAYTTMDSGKRTIHVAHVDSGHSRTLCTDCGYPYGWSADGRALITDALYDKDTWTAAEQGFYWLDVETGKKNLVRMDYYIVESRVSRDGHWLAFYVFNREVPDGRQILVARFVRGADGIPVLPARSEWIPITDGFGIDRNPDWSPDGNLLYFQSERDGFRCVWARRLDPLTKHPIGDAFAVYHSHSARLSLINSGHESATGLSVTDNQLIFSQGARTGAVWLTNYIPH